MGDGAPNAAPLSDASVVVALQERITRLEESNAKQNMWLERVLRGSVIVVDSTGCGLFRSIQEAINRCSAGDTIVLKKGTYTEPFTVSKHGITIMGARDEVLLENDTDKSSVVFKANSTVSGLTVVQKRKSNNCIRFEEGSGVLDNCDVSCANLSCVVVTGNSVPTIRNCSIHSSKQHGIAIKPNCHAVIEYCEIWDNGQPNITIEEGADPVIRHNIIRNGNQNGIWIKGKGKGMITDNEIHNNGYSNIDIMEGANPTISNNRIYNSAKCGICIAEAGLGLIQDNDIFSNGYSNVGIMGGGRPTVLRNLIHNSKQHGVFIKGNAGGVVKDNNVYANTLANIKMEDGCTIEQQNNQNTKLKPTSIQNLSTMSALVGSMCNKSVTVLNNTSIIPSSTLNETAVSMP